MVAQRLFLAAGFTALLALSLLSPHTALLTPPAVALFGLSTIFLSLLRPWCSRDAFLHVLWAASLVVSSVLFGWKNGSLIFLTPMAWLLLMHLLPNLYLRLAAAAAGLAALMWFRQDGFFSLSFWWIACQWLRCAAVSFEWKQSAWAGQRLSMRDFRAAALHFCAPPFLLSPIPMEWITFSYFRESIEVAAESKARDGARLLWTGLGFLLLYELCKNFVEPFHSEAWNLARLSQLSGEGAFHLRAGLTFFLLRLWQYCALTALVAGAWQLIGFPLRYDFDRPLLSRNGLDFWRRYHNYGREFLLRHIFYPAAFFFSRHLPWSVSAALGGALVFAMVVVVQATSLVPINGVPFSTTYSWAGSFNHTLWTVVFIALTGGFSALARRFLRSSRVCAIFEIGFTMLLLGWLFYNSFAQLWSNFSHAYFLRAIWPW